MALTKLSTDVIDLSTNAGALNIPKGATSNVSLTVDYLIVAGGGGGSSDSGGGAGAGGGGLLTNVGGAALTLAVATNYTVTVGIGGSVVTNGFNSLLSGSGITTVESTGGGAGAYYTNTNNGENGGSGGGGINANGTATGTGGIASPSGQGNNGGNAYPAGVNNGNNAAGGGGGAGAVGQTAGYGDGGDGGVGLQNAITGASTYYAGGGGGGTRSSGTAGTGGLGGGGDGLTYSPYSAGTAQQGGTNTGGGGGGSRSTPTSVGGSGVIILRYPNAFTATYTAGTGGTADSEVTVGTDKYIKITAGTGTVNFSGTPITTGRPSSPTEGLMRENTTTGKMEFYDGSLWQEITDTASSYSPGLIPAANFNTVIWDGDNATSRNITALNFKPDFVWFKSRTLAASNNIIDSVRGSANRLVSDNVTIQVNQSENGYVSSFRDDGFVLQQGSSSDATYTGWYETNQSGQKYVAWCWRAPDAFSHSASGSQLASTGKSNQAAGFSIVSFSSQSSGIGTVKHNLGGIPELIIIKTTGVADSWRIYNSSLGADKQMELDSTLAANSAPNQWNNTDPTDTVFTLGSDNAGSYDFISYCFKSIPGYSKIGFYVGNGSTTGPQIYTGFKPAWLMNKPTTSGYWYILDNKRNTSNPRNTGLFPNDSIAEITDTNYNVDFNNTGFQPKNNTIGFNNLGVTYIYMAFAE